MYLFVGFKSKINPKLLLITLNLFLLHTIYAGDIEQILPTNSNFTIYGDNNLEVIRVQSNGLVGIGGNLPNATLDINGTLKLDGAYYDKNGDVGTAGQVLTSTVTGTDWRNQVNASEPYITNSVINVATSTTQTITLTGYNFTSTSTVSIPSFDGSINSINVLSPVAIDVNITTGAIGTFDILVSNNGILNTQWAGNGLALLNVSNSNGQSQGAAGLTCKTLLNDGYSTGNGLYWIDPDGGSTANAFQVYCDMTSDGGGWTLVLRHDVSGGYFSNDVEADSFNQGLPGLSTKKYSILNKIDSIKNASSNGNPYEFRLYYPNENIRNHWTQTFDPRSGPSSSNPVAGYIPISIDATGSFWGGLEKSTSPTTFLDGSVNHSNWWYAIGTHSTYAGGMPGPSVVVQIVELYIR